MIANCSLSAVMVVLAARHLRNRGGIFLSCGSTKIVTALTYQITLTNPERCSARMPAETYRIDRRD